MGQVFISYSHKDSSYAMRLAGSFEVLGIPYWIDNQRLDVGTEWPKEIEGAIERSEIVVVVMSPDSETSEWVNKEINFAKSLDRRIFPLLLKGQHFITLKEIQYFPVTNQRFLPNEDFYKKIVDFLNPFLSKPIFSFISSEHRQADLRLLEKLWKSVNSENLRSFATSIDHGFLPYDSYSEIWEYLRERENLPENIFIIEDLEQTFAKFDQILSELIHQIGAYHSIIEKGNRKFLVPHYKLPDLEDGFEFRSEEVRKHKLEEGEKTVQMGYSLLRKHRDLVKAIKMYLPEFPFPKEEDGT